MEQDCSDDADKVNCQEPLMSGQDIDEHSSDRREGIFILPFANHTDPRHGHESFCGRYLAGRCSYRPFATSALSSLHRAHDPSYSDFSGFCRKLLTQLCQFQHGSVDLLHIDGLHTYEAVGPLATIPFHLGVMRGVHSAVAVQRRVD